MNHKEIRFYILFYLYHKHYSEELGRYHKVETIIEETPLKEIDKGVVYGDIVYLQDSGLVKGTRYSGDSYPPIVIITNIGIDYVDKIVNEFVEKEEMEFEQIRNEKDPKTKAKKMFEIIKSNQSLITTFINFLSKYSG